MRQASGGGCLVDHWPEFFRRAMKNFNLRLAQALAHTIGLACSIVVLLAANLACASARQMFRAFEAQSVSPFRGIPGRHRLGMKIGVEGGHCHVNGGGKRVGVRQDWDDERARPA
jgi:hypothetical protein